MSSVKGYLSMDRNEIKREEIANLWRKATKSPNASAVTFSLGY